MKTTYSTIKLDLHLRNMVDGAALGSLALQRDTPAHPDGRKIPTIYPPFMVLETFVFYVLRAALGISEAACCRYDPYSGLLTIRHGDTRGGDFVDWTAKWKAGEGA